MKRSRGFTLLEMAIVITIIGMIIGGIALAQNVIRNAEINNAVVEMQKHVQSMEMFRTKYNALPGDFAKASTYWSGVTDGSGNGLIEGSEQFLAWDHLENAKMVDGTYTGATGPAGASDRIPGINIPASQLSGAGWGLIYINMSSIASSNMLYNTGDALPGHVLWLGGRSSTGSNNQQTPVLTPQEAESIDKKIDDGYPDLGKVVAQSNTGLGVADCECDILSTCTFYGYKVTSNSKICSLVFRTGL